MLVVRATSLAFQWVFYRRAGRGAALAPRTASSPCCLYGIGVGAIASQWFDVELTPFLATSAVVGAVVGLALQDTLGNLFAGIALHSEAPVHVGDWVRVGERDGRVEQVSWRAMRLRTWDGDTLTVPNNEVARHAVLNYSHPRAPALAAWSTIGVNYHTPPNRVIAVLRKVLEQVGPARRARPPACASSAITTPPSTTRSATTSRPTRTTGGSRASSTASSGITSAATASRSRSRCATCSSIAPRPPWQSRETPGGRGSSARCATVDLFRPLSDEELRKVMARSRPAALRGGGAGDRGGQPGGQLLHHRPRPGGGLQEAGRSACARSRASWRASSSGRWPCSPGSGARPPSRRPPTSTSS